MSFRIVEKYIDGTWQEIKFEQLALGDIFRLWDAPGEPVVDSSGDTYWRCTSDPRMMDAKQHDSTVQNVLGVDIEHTELE